jgi:hypothetical protein
VIVTSVARLTSAPRALAVVFSAALATSLAPARADVTRALASPVSGAPHSLIVVADTSSSALVGLPARTAFDPSIAYSRAGCVPGRIYWRRGEGPPPDCSSPQWIEAAPARPIDGLHCDAARAPLAAQGWHAAGRLRQWDRESFQWFTPAPNARGGIECEDDSGRHGSVPGAWFATDGIGGPWSGDPRAEVAWSEHPERYALYSSRYVAWWHGTPASARVTWREAQRTAIAAALPYVPGSLTLLRHSWNGAGASDAAAEGGMVLFGPVSRGARRTQMDALWPSTPHGGGLPLAETLDEVARVVASRDVRYGAASRASPGTALPSAPESLRSAGVYRSPLEPSCSRASVVAMTSAVPSQDAGAPAANALGLAPQSCRDAGPGACAALFARALASPAMASPIAPTAGRVDVAWFGASALDPAVPGLQPTPSTPDALAPYVTGHARIHLEGPGTALVAEGVPEVTAVTPDGAGAWTAWALPSRRDRWLGGLRQARGGSSGSALEARPSEPARRRLFTDVAGDDLTAPANAVAPENLRLRAADLGLDPADEIARSLVLRWARGHDVDDADGDGNRDEARGELGAIVGAPGVVRYSGGRSLVFAGTGDGFLHAFDGATERWAYIPGQFLRALDTLRAAGSTGSRRAGIDGDMRVLLTDANGDRRVDAAAGERAVLLFGLRRGGRAYIAIDVSNPDSPRHLWTLGPGQLPGLAQTWASPVPVRLTIGGRAAGRPVVLLAGGHDPAQDRRTPRSRDRVGAAVYLVDAWSGELLWYASARPQSARRPDLGIDTLEYSVAATPRALDLDGDGEMDRAYVADTGGQVFRFDFTRGAPVSDIARAIRLASLGGTAANDRRFYAEPDVSLVHAGPGAPYAAIAIGSGFAADPRDVGVADRLYSLRDTLPNPRRPTGRPPLVHDEDLADVTDAAVESATRGWKRRLTLPGEKIVSPARTADHRVLVPAWRAPSSDLGPDCTLPAGANRLYSVDVRNGRSLAFRVIESPDSPDPAELPGRGVVPGAAFLAEPAAANCRGRCGPRVTALVGTAHIDIDWPGSLVRSGWVERERE